MNVGKVGYRTLDSTVLRYRGYEEPSLLQGPAVGGDGAVIRHGDGYLMFASDPITGAGSESGKFLVDINSNDIAALGGDPSWMTVTLLLPPTSTEGDIEEIMKGIDKEASELKIAIAGGHTEIVSQLQQPILSGSMVGLGQRFLDPQAVEYGDQVILSGAAGIEGTAILADLREEQLRESGVPQETLKESRSFLKELSVLEEARIGRKEAKLMHDPTEGGIIGALAEMADLIDKEISLRQDDIPIREQTREISRVLDIDPLRLISSGSLLYIFNPDKVAHLKDQLESGEVNVIGEIKEEGTPLKIEQDELWKVLER